jgi:chemotaxis response regulator CheB
MALDWVGASDLGLIMKGESKAFPDNSFLARFKGAFDVVALAASAGGLRAISEILAVLPADFLAAIVVVQHLDPRHRSLMADILSRRTTLKVKEAQEGAQLNPGTAYIAPPIDICWSIPTARFLYPNRNCPFCASLGGPPL